MKECRIELINSCNYKCDFCPVHEQTRVKEFMTPELYSDIITIFAKDYKQITLSGMGEPTLHPNFYECVRDAKAKGFKIIVLTNLSTMDIELFSKLDSVGLDWIHASWYEKEEQEKHLNEIFKIENRTTKIKLTYTPVNPGQYDTVTFINKFEGKADILEVWKPHNWGDSFNYRKLDEQINTCGRPQKGADLLQIQVDGTIVMCCYSWDNQLALGNIKDMTITEIFKSEAYRKILSAHQTGLFPDEMLCKNCDQRNAHKEGISVYTSTGLRKRENKTSTIYDEL